MNALLSIDGELIEVTPHEEHEFTMPTALVAKGYGVTEDAVRMMKSRRSDELLEETHWVVTNCYTLGGSQETTLWTKLGVVTLGFFMRSERAKAFRKAAAKLVIDATDGNLARNLTTDQLMQELIQRGIDPYEAIQGMVIPKDTWGNIAPNGKPKFGYRSGCFVASNQRVMDAFRIKQFLDNPNQLWLPQAKSWGMIEQLKKIVEFPRNQGRAS